MQFYCGDISSAEDPLWVHALNFCLSFQANVFVCVYVCVNFRETCKKFTVENRPRKKIWKKEKLSTKEWRPVHRRCFSKYAYSFMVGFMSSAVSCRKIGWVWAWWFSFILFFLFASFTFVRWITTKQRKCLFSYLFPLWMW